MPREPLHTFRVPDDVWEAARAKAADDGVSVSAVIVKALRVYALGEPCEYLAEREGERESAN